MQNSRRVLKVLRFFTLPAGFVLLISSLYMLFGDCASVGMPGFSDGTLYLWRCQDFDDGLSTMTSGIITLTNAFVFFFLFRSVKFWEKLDSILPDKKPKAEIPKPVTENEDIQATRERVEYSEPAWVEGLSATLAVIGFFVGIGVVIWALTGNYDGRVYFVRIPIFFAAIFAVAGSLLGYLAKFFSKA